MGSGGGGQVVNVLAFFLLWRSEFESLWSLQFLFCKLVKKKENKQKEAGDGPLKNLPK